MVNEMAEHALWSIWFRSGNEKANCELSKGAKAMDRRDFEGAVKHFTRAVRIDPKFAEAYNQRALARYMLERVEECAEDCERVVELMLCHLGAACCLGLGHCHSCRLPCGPLLVA